MTIKVRFFASLKESTGAKDIELNGDTIKTAHDAWRQATNNQALPDNILCAVNHQHTNLEHVINDGDEIGFFPPVTGG